MSAEIDIHLPSSDSSRCQITENAKSDLVLSLPEVLIRIFTFLTAHQQRRLAAQVCRQWRTIVQNQFLSVSGKAFPTNHMDESNWGGPATISLAAPRILQWKLGPRNTISENERQDIQLMTLIEYNDHQKQMLEEETERIDLITALMSRILAGQGKDDLFQYWTRQEV
ncbi:hypothetical protein FBU30_007083, partial [Linnemannia zychae]